VTIRVLSSSDIRDLLTPRDATEAVDEVFRGMGTGDVVCPPKLHMDMSAVGAEAWTNSMPAYLVRRDVAGVKWIGGYGANRAAGLPYIMGAIVLSDPRSGRTLAFMNAKEISDMRTGASAAVCARYLARPNVGAIAIVGAGDQGRAAAVCFGETHSDVELRACDICREQLHAFREHVLERTSARIVETDDPEKAVRGADVVVLLTTAKGPFVKDAWIGPGALVLAMGSYQQLEDAVALSADKVVVDSWGQAEHRGELKPLCESGRFGEDRLYAEIGAIAAGRKPGRESEMERILMVPVGLGAHDVALAHRIYERAVERGAGVDVPF
jgi:alanine dehydrogenase